MFNFDKDFLITKCPNKSGQGRCVVCEGFEKAEKEGKELSEEEIEKLFAEQEYINLINDKK